MIKKFSSFIFFTVCMVVILLVFSACNKASNTVKEDNTDASSLAPSETDSSANQTPNGNTLFSWEALGLDQIESPSMLWVTEINFDELAGEQASDILVDGLKHQNPIIQWYSSYKLIDYLDKIDRETVKQCLISLLESKEDYVRNSAVFTLSILNQTYDSQYITKWPNGDRYAFVLFPEAYLKDGRVFTVIDHHITMVYQGFNSAITSWSPDGDWLGITEITRITKTTVLANIKTGERVTAPSSTSLEQLEAYRLILNMEPYRDFRPDPYESLVDWSPDSKKVLLKYQYAGEQTDNQFYLVYGIQEKKALWVLKAFEASSDSTKPEGFNWNKPDYGIPAGAIDRLPSPEKLDKANRAMKDLVNAINDKNIDRLKRFIDPSQKRNNLQLASALDDFSHSFGNLPIQEFSYCGLDPNQVNSFRFIAKNEFSSRNISIQWNMDGAFFCTHPFLSLSAEVHQLIEEYTRALKEEDIQALIRILSIHKPYTEEQVKKMVENYKMGLDLKNMTIFFSSHIGDARNGTFYYEASNGAGNILNGIHVNYNQRKLSLTDSWLE